MVEWPRRPAAKGEKIAPAARIARVATDAVFLAALGEADTVTRALGRLAGKRLDPHVTAVFTADVTALLAEADGVTEARVVEIEPAPPVEIEEADLPVVAAAFGDLTDIKSPFTHGHSSEVASLSVAAATRLGLDRATRRPPCRCAPPRSRSSRCLECDLGEAGPADRRRVGAGAHAPLLLGTDPGDLGIARPDGRRRRPAPRRLDRSGYHRGCGSADLSISARILAAADSFQAMTQRRPHRPALDPDRARDELLRDAHRGRLDTDAVAAVLDAAGQPHPAARGDLRPAGLSQREVEVLRLVAEGCSNPEIGRRLNISRRTAEHHVQHIYTKLGISTRAGAALFALEHDLLSPSRRS